MSSRVIRVGLSALTLVPGVVGGSEVAFRSLMRELQRVDDIRPVALLPGIAPDAGEGAPSITIDSYRASTSTPGRLAAMALALGFGDSVRAEMRLDELDAVHFPFSTMIPRITNLPTVTSILDLQHEFLPEFFSRAELLYRRRLYARAARDSDLVIAISQHAAETLTTRLQIPPDRIRVIYLGADLERFTPARQARENFIFYPANRWAHKNHVRLFEALAILRRRHPDLRLVLTGSGHENLPKPEGVEILGRVSVERLVELYRTAAALAYPSLYEGFGMPLVEAMATGCPIAASDSSSIPEICGGAAALFDPTSPQAIADSVEDAISAPPDRIAYGLERARMFSWSASAAAHAAVYRELVS